MTPTLSECPFCGDDEVQLLEDPFSHLLTVRCPHCGIEVGWFISQKVAATMWNQRSCTNGEREENGLRVP